MALCSERGGKSFCALLSGLDIDPLLAIGSRGKRECCERNQREPQGAGDGARDEAGEIVQEDCAVFEGRGEVRCVFWGMGLLAVKNQAGIWDADAEREAGRADSRRAGSRGRDAGVLAWRNEPEGRRGTRPGKFRATARKLGSFCRRGNGGMALRAGEGEKGVPFPGSP